MSASDVSGGRTMTRRALVQAIESRHMDVWRDLIIHTDVLDMATLRGAALRQAVDEFEAEMDNHPGVAKLYATELSKL